MIAFQHSIDQPINVAQRVELFLRVTPIGDSIELKLLDSLSILVFESEWRCNYLISDGSAASMRDWDCEVVPSVLRNGLILT